MKTAITPHDIDLLKAGLVKAGIQISATCNAVCTVPVACRYATNPDGTLRWLWAAQSRTAAFLRFYHTGSMRARLAAAAMRTAVSMGLSGSVGFRSTILYVSADTAQTIADFHDWALFTGTVGETRKLVVWYRNDKGSFYAKFPLGRIAEVNLGNEVVGLNRADVAGIVKPEYQIACTSVLLQTDIDEDRQLMVPTSLRDLPRRALMNWITTGLQPMAVRESDWWARVSERMAHMPVADARFSPVLIARLRLVYDAVWSRAQVMMAASHGDFTPWNVRYKADELHIIDWEYYSAARPALYDVFHFIYQEGVLVKKLPYIAIRKQIDELLAQPSLSAFLTSNNIDAGFTELLYLTDVVSYYIDRYSRQEQWHIQIEWLLQMWCEALGYMLERDGQAAQRRVLLQDMTHFLHDTDYAVLKLQQADLSMLPAGSDVDMCIGREDAGKLYKWLNSHHLVSHVRVLKLSFMSRITAVLHDSTLLHLDCIWKFKRKSQVFMDTSDMLQLTHTNRHGAKVPRAMADARYVKRFYLLNYADVPARYQAMMDAFGWSGMGDVMQYNPVQHLTLQQEMRLRRENRGLQAMGNRIKYVIDTLKQLMPRRGHVITFSGVDGAGKSTVIEALKSRVEKELRVPVVVLRHRPSLLPILSAWRYGKAGAEQRSVSALPRTGTNRSVLSSAVRFAYYYTDYLLGQFYVHARYVWQGYTVLYDRYYFDFINDARRSNITVSSRISRWLYRFLVKPDQNYFLYAPAPVILQRKQELDEPAIKELTGRYMNLFSDLGQQDSQHLYDSVCNIELPRTLNKIFNNIKTQQICAH